MNDIVGQAPALRYLEATIQREKLASAYLFYGPSATGKRSAARRFLGAVLCRDRSGIEPCGRCDSCVSLARGTHPDYLTVETPESHLRIEDIRALQHQLRYRPALSSNRVALIGSADILTIEAANALLKTLEEPPPQTVLVLCTTALETLPSTVRSRCQQVEFRLVRQDAIEELLRERTDRVELARDVSHIAMGRPGLAITLLEHPEEYQRYQDRVQVLLTVLRSPISDRLRLLQDILPSRMPADTARDALLPILDLWIWLLRDTALLKKQNPEFMVHRFLSEELQRIGATLSIAQILRAIRLIEETQRFIRANVNPQFALEHCLIAI
ncbi:MAG: DNA polymerase III subunit delta' [Candidatus Kerfeldbacteria bacterium]|nr:DNA polymerase III subunit delta' [Candidatus Kerfeldbacteria bacterium]